MKPSNWDKQLGLASPRESAASQSDQTNNPSKNEVRSGVGLDVSHHTRISQRGGEKIFSLTSFFIGRVSCARELLSEATNRPAWQPVESVPDANYTRVNCLLRERLSRELLLPFQ
jgi:hypothetical protein